MPEPKLSKYFMPYQIRAIMHEGRLFAWEKSIRIGATYCMGFRAVRRRLLGYGDYLHSSVSLPAALEFVQEAAKWNDVFKIAAATLGEIQWEGAIENKAYQIKYPNGGRIIAFSSNPNAIRSFGGEVGIDEFAFHKDPTAMRKAAGGRAMWGYPISIWSSHNGVDSEWNRFLTEEKAKGARTTWDIMTTTIEDAIAEGLVEKINETRGTTFDRQQFLKDTRDLVGSDEAFDEECMCLPRKAGNAAIKWQFLEGALEDYDAFRLDISGDEPLDLTAAAGSLLAALAESESAALGYDVARTGDLSAIWINTKQADGRYRLAGLITMRNRRFGLQREIAAGLMERAPALVGAGDKTGLGMQICEELTDRFGESRFAGLNFGAQKADIGTKLTRVYEDGRQILPRSAQFADVVPDLNGVRTEAGAGGRTRFYEMRNPMNKQSHCDIAWANGLAVYAAENTDNHVGVW